MTYLIDTNIFLEILLDQELKETCKTFLKNNIGRMAISDFSLHSIGVILFRINKPDVFTRFVQDTLPRLEIVSLPESTYGEMPLQHQETNLDFDDLYQYLTAKNRDLKLVTLDADFKNVRDKIEIEFLRKTPRV